MPEVLVPIAPGTEELEAVTIIDVLRRAGCNVTVAAVIGPTITAAHGITIIADTTIDTCAHTIFDLIALPGGMPGAEYLRDDATLRTLILDQHKAGRPLAAICASPAVILQPLGLLDGRRATAYPGCCDDLPDQSAITERVVTDGHITTSRGPGTALEFALTLARILCGPDQARTTAEAMVVSREVAEKI